MCALLKKIKLPFFTQRTDPAEESSYLTDAADWKSLFQSATAMDENLRKAQDESVHLRTYLTRTLEAFNQVSQQQAAVLMNLIHLLDYCDSLDPKPNEIAVVQEQILSLLKKQDVKRWEPEIGKPMPEGCDPKDVVETNDYPPDFILEVKIAGYVWQGSIILRRPQVIVSQAVPVVEVEKESSENPEPGQGSIQGESEEFSKKTASGPGQEIPMEAFEEPQHKAEEVKEEDDSENKITSSSQERTRKNLIEMVRNWMKRIGEKRKKLSDGEQDEQ